MQDTFYLQKAIELSRLAPGGRNFRVGAVIVRDNTIISEGYSWELGEGTHAEENAFFKTGERELNGATLYCSMAPCTLRSSGKESCLSRSLREGIKRIIYACIAPDEDILKIANDGITLVHIKDLEKTAQEVNPHLNWK